MRQVLTSNKSMPATMTVLANENCHKSQLMHQTGGGTHILNADSNNGMTAINQSGQFILVQRAGIAAGENRAAPRASSAPPAQNQVRVKFAHILVSIFYLNCNREHRFMAVALAWQSAVAVARHRLTSINQSTKRSLQRMMWGLMLIAERCLSKVRLLHDIPLLTENRYH